MSGSYLQQTNERQLPNDYAGPLLLWDIDKTYLSTRFSSFRGLLAIPFELAIDKQAVAGVVPLIRGLRHGPGEDSAIVPLYFISGSPPQLRTVIQQKMTLDGVDFDGITFKDQWGLMRAGRPRDVARQVGYKLKALLMYRAQMPAGARWIMFGDDAESDADIFLLFGEVCARLRGTALQARLRSLDVSPADIQEILRLAEAVAVGHDPVELICIRQVRQRDFTGFDARVLPSPSYLSTALALAHRGYIRRDDVQAVARSMRRRGETDAGLAYAAQLAQSRFGVPDDLVSDFR